MNAPPQTLFTPSLMLDVADSAIGTFKREVRINWVDSERRDLWVLALMIVKERKGSYFVGVPNTGGRREETPAAWVDFLWAVGQRGRQTVDDRCRRRGKRGASVLVMIGVFVLADQDMVGIRRGRMTSNEHCFALPLIIGVLGVVEDVEI